MKRFRWEIITGIFLLLLSIGLAWIHYAVFRDMHTLLFYIMEDVTFLPIQVLLVTLVIESLLSFREKQGKLNKLNMVIEVFFSEVGVTLLRQLYEFERKQDGFQTFSALDHWTDRDFHRYLLEAARLKVDIDCRNGDLEQLRVFLMGKRNFMLRLLENPNLLEHESFTDLLWAVFHLTEELGHRKSCSELCEADRSHFAHDIQRAYVLLIYQWLGYMRHLKANYPYLFSLASRLNPFNPEATAEIKE